MHLQGMDDRADFRDAMVVHRGKYRVMVCGVCRGLDGNAKVVLKKLEQVYVVLC